MHGEPAPETSGRALDVRGGCYTGGMPRTAREDPPGSTQHVSFRGVNGIAIFQGDRDRERFLARAEVVLREAGVTCLAWALLDNHAHFLLRLGDFRLRKPMSRLLTSHAQFFNKRQERYGHLLQGRYSSKQVLDASHLVEAVRYILLNPVRAGLVHSLAELEMYPWCGCREVMGLSTPGLIGVRETLLIFGLTEEEGRRELTRWMAAGLSLPNEELEARLARFENPEDAKELAASTEAPDRQESEAISWSPPGRSPEELIQEVCLALEVPVEALLGGSRKAAVCKARAILAELLSRANGGSPTSVASDLNITASGVCRIRPRGQARLRDRDLQAALQAFL